MGRKSGAIGFAVYLDLLERMDKEHPEFDVDILLLCDESADAKAVVKAVEELQKEGSVLVAKERPEDLCCRKVLKFTQGGPQNG
jgi:ATP phosphoribosyltransferase regulatory subunit